MRSRQISMIGWSSGPPYATGAPVPGAVSAWRSPALQLQLLHRKQPELYFFNDA